MARIFNFGAGPAALPLPVLEKAREELLDYAGTGMSIMEMSHRSKPFDAVIKTAEANIRRPVRCHLQSAVGGHMSAVVRPPKEKTHGV